MSKMKVVRTDSKHPDFIHLENQLDSYLTGINGDEDDFFRQFNKLYFPNVVVAYDSEMPIGCGAFKVYDATTVEIKRMFTLPNQRGKGVAKAVLVALENWAAELGFETTILETGREMPDAVGLYTGFGYVEMENYDQYIGVESSICLKKSLKN